MAEGAAPTCPLPVRRSPVLARLEKASSALHDQVQLLLLSPDAAFISREPLFYGNPPTQLPPSLMTGSLKRCQ